MIYTARVLDQNRTLLGILDCTKWGYSRKISEATEVSISIPRKQTSAIKNCDELFAFMNPFSPTETNDSWDTSTDPTQELAYFIEIYKDKQRLITALIAKRDFTDTTIELKCYTEETLLTKYLTPAQYGSKYESWDIADIARDMAKGWSVQRIKAKSQWDAGTLVNVDTSTEPGKVLLSKTGGTYNASGSVTLTFSRPTNWANWERIRWVGDFDGAVAVKMQYSTDGGSTWSAEYVGGEPDTLGIEIATTSATTVMVRLNLSTSDTTSQDSSGNAVGVTPRLFAVEVIARTTSYITVSAEASTGLLCNGLEIDKATPLAVMQAACSQVGQEFWVDNNTLYLGTMGSDKSNDIFLRKGTNMRITQLGDELAEVYNVIHATGSGSGINRLEYTESDTNSIATYGVRETTQEFDTEDYDELVTLAQAYLAEHKEPIYAWKIKAQYPIDDEPTYGCGDTITVTDGVIVTTSRIEQMDRSYDNGISVMLYLNKTRADLIQRVKPTYSNLTTFERPIALSVYPTIKGLIASVSRPVDLSRWDYTELHLSTTADFTPSFETLNSEKKATMFEVNDLSPGTRYYVKVRHIANDGTASEFSDERSAVALAVTATDIDVRAGWDLAENSPSTGQVLIYGKDIDGNATEENGFITSGSGVLTVNYQAITPIDDKTNFLRLSAGVVIPIYYDVNDNKFYDASVAEVTTGVIIGTVTKASGSITSSQAYARAVTIEQGKADQVSTAMRYLAQATDSESFDAIAKGLGIENAFYTLAVYNGFITNLFAQQISVTKDGSIGSEDFSEDEEGIPTSGFMLDNPLTPIGRRGRVRSHGGIFNNATIYGTILHDALVTRKSAPTTPVTFPSKTAWNRKDFWNALSVTENSADMIATDLNIAGTTYSYLRKITSATFEKQIIAYARYVPTTAVTNYYHTSPAKGQARINAATVFYFAGEYFAGSLIEVYIDDVKVATYSNPITNQVNYHEGIFQVNKGSIVRIKITIDANYSIDTIWAEYGINYRGIQNSLQVSNVTTSWDTIEGMASDYLVRGRWQCSSPISFDSNSILAYSLANAFISGFSSLPQGVEIQADNSVSKVTYGGLTDQPINSVINYGSSVRLNYTGGYVTFVAGSDADGSFTGWYNASASISVLSKEGIVVSNIIPKDDTREIGEFDNPFKKGFFEELNSSGPVNAQSINTGGLGAFLIGQNLRTTDSPTFAGVNTGYGANHIFKNSIQSVTAISTSSGSTTTQLSAMDIGEIRFVFFTCNGWSNVDNSYPAYLRTPSGGNFYISPVVGSSTSTPYAGRGGSYAGNSNFAVFYEGDNAFTGVFIIRRNS